MEKCGDGNFSERRVKFSFRVWRVHASRPGFLLPKSAPLGILITIMKQWFDGIFHFFDKLVDEIRHELSKRPVIYAFIGGFATVLFWRGVWEFADYFSFLTPGVSIIISVIILIGTGTFVSFFVGEKIIESGLREDKRIDQKTEEEVVKEEERVEDVYRFIAEIRHDVFDIRKRLDGWEKKEK